VRGLFVMLAMQCAGCCVHCKQRFLLPNTKDAVIYNNLLFGFAVACPLYLRMSSGEKPSILSCSRIAFRNQSKLRHTIIDSQNAPRCNVYSCLHRFKSYTSLLRSEGWHGVQNLREDSDPMHDVSMTTAKRLTAPSGGVCMAWRFCMIEGESVSSQMSPSSARRGLRRRRTDVGFCAREDLVTFETPSALRAEASAMVRDGEGLKPAGVDVPGVVATGEESGNRE
jgi:hypothetical protein